MSVYVSWTRVEPDHRAVDPRSGARVPVADPFWSLGRQWWIGELEGFDGGTPVASRVDVSVVPLTEKGRDRRHEVVSARLAAPMSAPTERRAGEWRGAYRLGRSAVAALAARLHQLRIRVEAGTSEREELETVRRIARTLPELFPLDVPKVVSARIPRDHRIDGVSLLAALRRPEGEVADLADLLAEWTNDHADVVIGQGSEDFSVETGRHTVTIEAGDAVVGSRTARGPALHWSDLTADVGEVDTSETQRPVPVQLHFEGAPPVRWWGIEDPAVDYASAPAGPSDLGQLLIAASLQEQGGVYWQLPLDVPAACLLRVDSVELIDSFGERRTSRSLENPDIQGWKLADGHEVNPVSTTEWMLILNEPHALRGEPLEEVGLVADETDNLVWLIEDIAPGELGRGVRLAEPTPRPPADREVYHPRLTPPDTWVAYQQVAADRLERALLVPSGRRAEPRTRFAIPELRMLPAMLGAGGHRLRSEWSLARTPSGRRVIWKTRRSLADLPRGGSGLLHDQIVRPAP